jgi:Immunoglobulin domain
MQIYANFSDPNASATEAPPIYRSPVDPLLIDGHFGGEGHDPDGWSHLPAGGSMPVFTEISRTPGRLIQLTADSTLRLKCVSQGEPLPHLLWYKDGREINDERRSGRWGLQVPNIRPEDSGTYTCQAINPFGSINASFIIQVVRKSLHKKSMGSRFEAINAI